MAFSQDSQSVTKPDQSKCKSQMTTTQSPVLADRQKIPLVLPAAVVSQNKVTALADSEKTYKKSGIYT